MLADDQLSLWDISTSAPQKKWDHKPIQSTSLVFDPDQGKLAVAQETSIALFDLASGRVTKRIPMEGKTTDRKLDFGTDGQWLASTQGNNEIRILDYHGNDLEDRIVATQNDVLQFAFAEKEILTVEPEGKNPAAFVLELGPDGLWKRNQVRFLPTCTQPDSVSVSRGYVSATWQARTCTFDLQKKTRTYSYSRPTARDIVLSPNGTAFAKITVRNDVIVGVGNPAADNLPTSRIKGANPPTVYDLTPNISLSNNGTRVAVKGKGSTAESYDPVRIYSIADQKPLLSSIHPNSPQLFALAPDGRWMVLAKPTAKSPPREVIEIIPLDPGAASGFIELPARPSKICASQDSVTAVLPSQTGSISVVYDVATGKEKNNGVKTNNLVTGGCGDKAPVFQATPPLPGNETTGVCKITRSSATQPTVKVSKGMIANTHQGYEIHWTRDKNGQFAMKLRRSTGDTPLNTCTIADDRWLAYWDGKRVDLLDLQEGKLTWEFRADEEPVDAEFESDNLLLKVRFGSKEPRNITSVMLIPVGTALLQRYVKWLVPRELSDSERCTYALGGKECLTEASKPESVNQHRSLTTEESAVAQP